MGQRIVSRITGCPDGRVACESSRFSPATQSRLGLAFLKSYLEAKIWKHRHMWWGGAHPPTPTPTHPPTRACVSVLRACVAVHRKN